MPKKWHCFLYSNKYSMKYDFSTYLAKALNEKVKQPSYDTVDDIKTALDRWVADDGEMYNAQNQDKISDDTLLKLKKSKAWKEFLKNADKKYKDRIDIIKELDTNKEQKAKALNKDGFELLGKTIAYRSALTVWNIINNSGDDFKQAALDVFKDNSEYSIKQLENLDSLLDYSAAVNVIKEKKNRLDKNEENYESLLKKYNDTEAKLTTKENYTTIQQIKKDYEKEFKDKRDVYEKAFNDGMAEQKKDMQAKDYKWKDPATGLPPKGKLAKSNQAADAIFKSIQSGVEKADEFAKRQQGMDKVILTLAVMGVKGMMFGGKMLKKLLTGFLKKTNLKDIMRYTAKFNDVKDKINVFKKEYDEWKKYNDAQKQKKDKTDDEKKEEEDRKKTISMKLSELMNTHVIPYYYCKMAIIVACFENIEGKYIIKQENNKWSTYNSGSGRLTIIEDNAILMERILEVVNDQLVKKGVFETLKDEYSTDAFKGIPKDLIYKKDYADKLLKWKDKIKSVSTVSKFNKDNLKNILNVYNEKVIVNGFASYAEFAEYVPEAQGLVELHDIPVAKEIVIKFDGDEDAGIPGIISGAKKENNQEEQNPEEQENNGIDKEQINKDYKEINAALEELKNVNELNKVNDKFDTINSKVNDTVDQLKGVVDKETDEAKKKKLKELLMAKTSIDKVIAIKAVMNNYKLTESVAMNEIIRLLNEDAEEGTEEKTPDIEVIKKKISEIIGGDITLDNASEYTKKSEDVYKKIADLYNAQNDDTKKKLEEYKDKPLQLLYSLGAINGEKKEQTPVDTNQTQEAINKTKQAIETAEDTDTIFTDKYYDELKGELKDVYSTIDKMTKNNNELLQAFLNIKIDDDIKDELLPQLWHYKRFLTILFEKQKEAKKQEEGKKESYNPFYAHDMLVLLEAETEENKDNNNVVEALKAKTKAIKEILAQQDMPEFNKAYKVWKDEINKLLEKFDKIENKDKLTDPLQKLSAMGNYIKNKPEVKKKETPQPAEEG